MKKIIQMFSRKKKRGSVVPRSELELFYENKLSYQYRVLHERLNAEKPMLKTTSKSKRAYEAYDDREQLDYENNSRMSVYNDQLVEMPFKESRAHYLAYLYREIDKLLVPGKPLRVLEVGCGNCINIACLNEKYGNRVEITGLELSPRRINVAKKYFEDGLSGVSFQVGSITEPITGWEDEKFDLVYSMHCLEQIAYECKNAVRQMNRLSKSRVVMIEPIFELGNPIQRLYLINSDHNRILLSSIQELELEISRLEPLNIQSNPSNQSSIVVINKTS